MIDSKNNISAFKTNIEKAQAIYDYIIGYSCNVYGFFIQHILKKFNILYIGQIDILHELLSENEAHILVFKVSDDGKLLDLTYKDNIDFKEDENEKYDEETGCYYVDLNKHKDYNQRYIQDRRMGIYSILATLYLWENRERLNLNYNNLSLIKENDNDVLIPIIKRSFAEFCVEDLALTENSKIHSYCDAITIMFFIYLWKSIACAEFYIIPEYENKIRTIKSEQKDDFEPRILPAFINYYSDISSFIKTFINRVTPFNHDGEYELNVELDEDLIVDYIPDKYLKTDILNPLMKLTQQLLDITIIDIRYVASEKNLSKLVNFIYALKRFKDNLSSINSGLAKNTAIYLEQVVAKSLKINALDLFHDTINTLTFKACILAKQIIKQTTPKEKICFEYSGLADAEISELIEQYETYEINYNKDIFHCLYNGKYELSTSEYKKYIQVIEALYKDNCHFTSNFIKTYNYNVNRGFNTYQLDHRIFTLIQGDGGSSEIIDAVKELINRYDAKDNKNVILSYKEISPSTLVKAIEWFYRYLKNSKECHHEEITLYGKLLNCLRHFIVIYKNGNDSPYRFRSYFEHSFYQIDGNNINNIKLTYNSFNNYNCLNFEKSIFIASFGYTPINLVFLENFFLSYNRRFRILESIEIQKSIDISNKLSTQSQETILTIKEERGRTLQLVGLLGTFIAFVASLVGNQKVANNIYDFCLFALTFMTGVLVFILCVNRIVDIKKDIKITDSMKLGWRALGKMAFVKIVNPYWIIVIILLIVMFLLVSNRPEVLGNLDSDIKKKTQTEYVGYSINNIIINKEENIMEIK